MARLLEDNDFHEGPSGGSEKVSGPKGEGVAKKTASQERTGKFPTDTSDMGKAYPRKIKNKGGQWETDGNSRVASPDIESLSDNGGMGNELGQNSKMENTGGQWEHDMGGEGIMPGSTGGSTNEEWSVENISSIMEGSPVSLQELFNQYARQHNYVCLEDFQGICQAYGLQNRLNQKDMLSLMEHNNEFMFTEGKDSSGTFWYPINEMGPQQAAQELEPDSIDDLGMEAGGVESELGGAESEMGAAETDMGAAETDLGAAEAGMGDMEAGMGEMEAGMGGDMGMGAGCEDGMCGDPEADKFAEMGARIGEQIARQMAAEFAGDAATASVQPEMPMGDEMGGEPAEEQPAQPEHISDINGESAPGIGHTESVIRANAKQLIESAKKTVREGAKALKKAGDYSTNFVVRANGIKTRSIPNVTEAALNVEELIQAGGEGVEFEAQICDKGGAVALRELVPLATIKPRGALTSEGKVLFRYPRVAHAFARKLLDEGITAKTDSHNWGVAISGKIPAKLIREAFAAQSK